ncbi:MAG: head-tail joining protein [Phycisphaerales bacterium]|nr:head-tail joining protein [Phycisphaerales bacterium]
MPGAFLTSDLPTMFSVGEFAVSGTLDGAPLTGIFDAAYIDPLGVVSNSPVLVCASSDLSLATRGSVVIINAISYFVRDIQPDGTGMTVLILERA